jgi:hypothetical protein
MILDWIEMVQILVKSDKVDRYNRLLQASQLDLFPAVIFIFAHD